MANDPLQTKQIEDLLAFPVLTREVGTAAPAGGTAAVPGTAPLAQIVANTLREILGWRPRTGDAKSFLAALNQSFTCQEVEGRMECKWTPRSSAIGIQADLGAITGAQASLYARARNMLDQVLPLLDSLRSLRSEFDPEDNASARAIVRSALAELAAELGTLGGARVPRVDEIFLLLLGPNPDLANPENVQGHLRLLRERFGLLRSQVNTVDEERVYTDFLLIVDYVNGLKQAWDAQRSFFFRNGTDAFLGTQLVLLSRELAVAAESVRELYDAMDSVFLGAAERETVVLDFGGGQPPLTVAELFGWVERFVTEEGPRLIQDAGKDGVTAFRSTLLRLRDLVGKAADIARRRTGNPNRGYHTERVEARIEGVYEPLVRAAQLALAVRRMGVDAVFSRVGRRNGKPVVQVFGDGFAQGATVSFGPGIDVLSSQVLSPERLEARIRIANNAAFGPRAVTVTNPEGEGSNTLTDAFTVLGPVKLTSLSRRSAPQGERVTVVLHGQNFDPDAWASFGPGTVVVETRYHSPRKLEAVLQIRDIGQGVKSVAVVGGDGSNDSLQDAFTITTDPVEIDSIDPARGTPGEEIQMFLVIPDLKRGQIVTEVRLESGSPPATLVTSTGVTRDGEGWRAGIELPGTAGLKGRFDVIAKVLAGDATTEYRLPAGFTIPGKLQKTLSLKSVEPAQGHAGEILRVDLAGTGFDPFATTLFGEGVLVNGVTNDPKTPETLLHVHLEIEPGAEGIRHVAVVNGDGTTVVLPAAFTIVT